MNIDNLLQELQENEAKVIYNMIKATTNTRINEYENTSRGVPAIATLDGNTVTVEYQDGTVTTYTEV